MVALPSSESLVSAEPKSKQQTLLVRLDEVIMYSPSGCEPVGTFLTALLRYPVPMLLTSTPKADWPAMVIGSAIAFAPMSEPFGPGPDRPLEQPDQDLPGEIGRFLALDDWSSASVTI